MSNQPRSSESPSPPSRRIRTVAARETVAEVAALLSPNQPKTPREINARLPLTGRGPVYNALAELVRNGVAVSEGEICKRRYRLAGDQR